MWLVLSHQEPQTQYKSEIKEKTLSRQESLDGLRISQKSAKTPLFTEFSDGLGGVFSNCGNVSTLHSRRTTSTSSMICMSQIKTMSVAST